uniref:Protein kinase domain-containing protein n=1 Tax=Oryza punctata TaxID=4537 RepID=A0A0E0KNX6_ORYPU
MKTPLSTDIALSRVIPVRSGIAVYNMSWILGDSLTIDNNIQLIITGCGLDVYLLNDNKSRIICRLTCSSEGRVAGTIEDLRCENGAHGCYFVSLHRPEGFHLQFVRRQDDGKDKPKGNASWDTITIETASINTPLSWFIVDNLTCTDASLNMTSYACVSNHSRCSDALRSFFTTSYYPGYLCQCDNGYQGNPYIPDGCSLDQGYIQVHSGGNCTRSCENIIVPYPFGLEEGCSAREEFLLSCINSNLQISNSWNVSRIDVNRGVIDLATMESSSVGLGGLSNLFTASGKDTYSVHFAVAKLSCQQAKQNMTQYACMSVNSTCLPVNLDNDDAGYRCMCSPGFDGNPYIKNGCQDVDECLSTPGICRGICHNTIGNYICTKCPSKTEYDEKTKQCTSGKRQKNILLGIIIGLSAGFGILLLGISATLLIRKWRKNIQKKLRKKNFEKNQGLLLEQLISSDETTTDRMNIFTLEELEKATNNFDHTRILGRGGHGMVYKGILADQRVVAIKRSVAIKQGEITQFINEVAILSQINHRNIVKLFGCCLETEVPLLVYDFVSNGSLFDLLRHNSSSSTSISWGDALRIAVEVAGALYYLHSAASVSVFHRDVKSSNILLDANYTAKVSDFGTSRLVSIDQTHVVTRVQGTFGYLDPEYCQTGQLNEKSDVYSFGVVLLELLLLKELIFITESGSKLNLAGYFLQELKVRPARDIVAAHIYEGATEEEVNNIASLVELCLRPRGDERPTMKQVEMVLQSLREKVSNKLHVTPKNDKEEMEPLLGPRAEASSRSNMTINLAKDVNASSPYSQGCFSLEREFMATAELPR